MVGDSLGADPKTNRKWVRLKLVSGEHRCGGMAGVVGLRNSGGRYRNINVDHVKWVKIGATMPPDERRCAANRPPITPEASTNAGLRVALVAST